MKIYCKIMETDVEVTNNECSLKVGSPALGFSSCPNKNSLICPIKATSPNVNKVVKDGEK